jgi:subtilisin family serine protease
VKRVLAIGFWGALLLCLRPLQADSAPALLVNEAYRPGIVLVGVRPGSLAAVLDQLSTDRRLAVVQDLTPLSVISVRVPIGQERAVADSLRRSSRVEYAELDCAAQALDVITPTDPGWYHQWGPRQIYAPAAWATLTHTVDITIAVVDSGIKLDHPDLAGQRWINPGEIPGNLVDDDGNGKIDDVNGWHFYQYCVAGTCTPRENANVQDDYGHGTHVAGIAAAALDNGIGIAGVAPQARIMPVKVIDQYGVAFYSDIALGIVYAADNGARVINLSLGGKPDSQTLRDAVDYARARGALVVAAAGNDGGAVLHPAAYNPVLAVAATDQADQVAYFSNRGPQVDAAAPGVDIYSTWPWVTGYFTKSGTSMAAPHISGVAALIWSQYPLSSSLSVAYLITSTAVDIATPGWDEQAGWGRVDAYRALRGVTNLYVFLPTLRR